MGNWSHIDFSGFCFFSFLCCYLVSGLFYFYTPEICHIPNGPDQNHKAVNTSLGFPSGAERTLRALEMRWETVPVEAGDIAGLLIHLPEVMLMRRRNSFYRKFCTDPESQSLSLY